MIVGIDFDNTLADYTGVFHRVARQLGWIPQELPDSKKAVKGYFMDRNEEPVWTELQGLVYGRDIGWASLYDGAQEVIRNWLKQEYEVHIVSHKTRYPVIGDKINLHDAAMKWLIVNDLVGDASHQVNKAFVHFNETREEKIQVINKLGFDYFIDDLPAVFDEKSFNTDTTKILFDPDLHYDEPGSANILCHRWSEIEFEVQ